MTLAINRKYHSFHEKFWDNNIPAFDVRTLTLTTVPRGYQGPFITDLERTSQLVNSIAKPVFRDIDRFYNVMRNLIKINDSIKEKN